MSHDAMTCTCATQSDSALYHQWGCPMRGEVADLEQPLRPHVVDLTPNERTKKKKRQRRKQLQRYRRMASASANLARAVEQAWADAPGDVKRALVAYRDSQK